MHGFKESRQSRLVFSILRLDDSHEIAPDSLWRLGGIKTRPDALVTVVIDDWSGLLMISLKSFAKSLLIVIGSTYQRLARDVVLSRLFRRLELFMISSATGRMNKTTTDASDQQGIVNVKLNSMIKLLFVLRHHFVQLKEIYGKITLRSAELPFEPVLRCEESRPG